jgi:hypothetical protein
MANVAKGEKREYETSAAVWIDLLGYGAMLEEADWNPTSVAAKQAIERIVAFQEIVTRHSMRHFPTFVMNDGAVAYRDLSARSCSPTFDFLRRAYALHNEINATEEAKGHPGARAVLAVGLRVRRTVDYSRRLNGGEGLRIREKLNSGKISSDQAISHALMARHHCDSTPELQHNYALTKAYLADSSGKKGGIGGARFFVDRNIFGESVPKWVTHDTPANWANRGMQGVFLPISSIDIAAANSCEHDGVLDAFSVVKRMYQDPTVLASVKASRVGDLRVPAKGSNSSFKPKPLRGSA